MGSNIRCPTGTAYEDARDYVPFSVPFDSICASEF